MATPVLTEVLTVVLAVVLATTPIVIQRARVLSIGDGDTLRVSEAGRTLTLRLACIDAPERAQAPYGARSKAALVRLVPVGSELSVRVQTKDRYGRSVAELFSSEGRNINLAMVQQGQAFVFHRYLKRCDRKAYLEAERQAQRQRLGIWSQQGITRPWIFRTRE
jgi:endonuclease YncB( thermonuclease family)